MNLIQTTFGAITMSIALAAHADVDTSTLAEQDAAAIETIVHSVATFADRGEFQALERLYAPQVLVDYTSLAGGQPELKTPKALMEQWAAVLPGFDRTRHAISGVQVRVSGDRAQAKAFVIADHWLSKQHWQVSGRYDYELVRSGSHWKISAHKFTVIGEKGSRDIFGPAIEAAKQRPISGLGN